MMALFLNSPGDARVKDGAVVFYRKTAGDVSRVKDRGSVAKAHRDHPQKGKQHEKADQRKADIKQQPGQSGFSPHGLALLSALQANEHAADDRHQHKQNHRHRRAAAEQAVLSVDQTVDVQAEEFGGVAGPPCVSTKAVSNSLSASTARISSARKISFFIIGMVT